VECVGTLQLFFIGKNNYKMEYLIALQLFAITYGKLLVTINRATGILQTGDHFFVPKGECSFMGILRYVFSIL
jgi:hypothetical protein